MVHCLLFLLDIATYITIYASFCNFHSSNETCAAVFHEFEYIKHVHHSLLATVDHA